MLVINIKHLVNVREECKLLRGHALSELPVLENAWLQLENGKIAGYGLMRDLDSNNLKGEIFDAKQGSVFPSWCDSHTHLVFAASREQEFVDKLKGLSYEEIAAKGGGILNSAKAVKEASEELLFELAQNRLNELIRLGTGAIEIKSGYGLSVEGELKMLRVIRELKRTSKIPVKATFLGAHAVPDTYKTDKPAYIDLLIKKMLPAIAAENLADYIDVFCEKGFFTEQETVTICKAGNEYGLRAKIHANQLHNSGGVQTGYAVGALSVDHLETIGEAEILILSKQEAPIATLLPGAAFFLRMQYPPARDLIRRDAAIALASDLNPGSCPSGNMNLVVSLACTQMKLLPGEAINAATINGAFAMGLQDSVGSITLGKAANLFFTRNLPSLAYLPYSFGTNLIEKVMIAGEFVE